MPTTCAEIICATSCAQALPETEFNLCSPETNFGEIEEILVTNIGNPLVDENDPAEWATRFALSATDPTKITRLFVVGSKPAPEGASIMISRDTEIPSPKTHTIPFKIFETNQKNYEFLRTLECGKKLLVWYKTADGALYGGAKGIEVSITMNEIIPESRQELTYFEGSLKWKSKHHPCRTVSVI